MAAENEPTQINYRRYSRDMTISAIAVIAFATWSILRAGLYFVLHHVDLIALFGNEYYDEFFKPGSKLYEILNVFNFGYIMLFLIIDLLIRCYVGLSAISDASLKKKKSVVYIVLAIIMGVMLIAGFVSEITLSFSDDLSKRVMYELTASAVIDLTSGFALLELAASSIIMRICRKKLQNDGKMIYIENQKR